MRVSWKTGPGSGWARPGPPPWMPGRWRCFGWGRWWPSGRRRSATNGAPQALAAGATDVEIAEVLLAIAPVAGLSRVASAAPDVAAALGYDIATALEEPDDY